jgi:hypothetical protein
MGSERGLTNAVPNHSYPQRLLCVLRGQLLDIVQDNPVFRFEFLDCFGGHLLHLCVGVLALRTRPPVL